MNLHDDSPPGAVRAAFERQTVELPVAVLRPHRPLVASATHCKKFLQVLASVATLGLVEPLVVIQERDAEGYYVVLDGRLRLEAFRRLGKESAICLFATADETYTYNRHVNRLTAGQDARMIAQAVRRGVSQERIAAVLGVNERTVKAKVKLLTGIGHDVAALLADKNCPAATYEILKSMRPLRQLEAAELMCSQDNFSSAFARAIKLATPPEQLIYVPASNEGKDEAVQEQIDRLEREIASLQTKVTDVEERYGVEHMHLAVSLSYVTTLLENKDIRSWLTINAPGHYANLHDSVTLAGPRSRSRQVMR
ncbi:plasmid partitioning protein RepB C-terminal domain-containing protein [Paraburkholderia diazotrophica]|uniref:ParB-like nuclease domain-containing protein n=1 Tax=Paraburkholderia diazotrophica TaxID=667676 RepID=A0A1H7D637_9BURK|nr:plasmid partitioning protein RepB C-terminal domain-containing protein [Paraburkholderia diazotrophica]SEJ96784.1 ParB-like nuclease domain-containing protein [Paraburkholderia diazotrophica]